MTAIKRSAQASLVFIQSGTLPPAGISQSWTATSCPASLRVQAIQCALVPSAELQLMKNFCPIEAIIILFLPHHRRLPHSSSASRFTADASGFFIFSHSGELPERQAES